MTDDSAKNHLLAELTQATLALLQNPGFPSLKEATKELRMAVPRAAFHASEGNVTRAAKLLGVTRVTFRDVLGGSPIQVSRSARETLSMHEPFDDQLFPFVRVLWPAEPSEAWASQYAAWLVEVIIPRVLSTGMKCVNLENWDQMTAVPRMSTLSRVNYLIQETTSHAPHGKGDEISAGAVFYAPHVPVAGFLAPIVNIAPVPVRIATSVHEVETHAAALFKKAGVAVPAELSLD